MFADANGHTFTSQLRYIVGFVYGHMKQRSVIHFFTWTSHRSRQPVGSAASFEILAPGEGFEEFVYFKIVLSDILKCSAIIASFVDLKYLCGSLLSKHHSTDKSVRGDVKTICFYHETSVDQFCGSKHRVTRPILAQIQTTV